MRFTRFLLFFSLLITPLTTSAGSQKNSGLYKLEAKKKHKGKDKKLPTPPAPQKPQESPNVALQKFYDLSIAKSKQAQEKESSASRTFKNAAEVSNILNDAAKLYDEAVQAVKEALKLTVHFSNKASLEKDLQPLVPHFESQAKRCRHEAKEWPDKVLRKKRDLYKEVNNLKRESSFLEKQGATRGSLENYKRIVSILQQFETDAEELAACQKKVDDLEAALDAEHRKLIPPELSWEKFQERERSRRDLFFQEENRQKAASYTAIPLDGQGTFLYTQQFYRYLVRRDTPGKSLTIKAFKEGRCVYEEQIEIPAAIGDAWEHYLAADARLLVPKTELQSRFGLDLRLAVVLNPYDSFSLVIAQKGSDPNYDFSFFLDDQPLYDVHLIEPPPWQLEALCKPALPSIEVPLELTSFDIDPASDDGTRLPVEALSYPLLDQFVKEMKGDALALTQYVYNEIENEVLLGHFWKNKVPRGNSACSWRTCCSKPGIKPNISRRPALCLHLLSNNSSF